MRVFFNNAPRKRLIARDYKGIIATEFDKKLEVKMSFAENLQYLRKREKITQEELSEELNVSRQSVSKWETGEAYPETEKIIILCDKFNVTMDELMRGRVDKENCAEENPAEEKDNDKIKREFSEHMDWFSKRIGIGVTVILIGIAFILTFTGTIYREIPIKFLCP